MTIGPENTRSDEAVLTSKEPKVILPLRAREGILLVETFPLRITEASVEEEEAFFVKEIPKELITQGVLAFTAVPTLNKLSNPVPLILNIAVPVQFELAAPSMAI